MQGLLSELTGCLAVKAPELMEVAGRMVGLWALI